MADVFGSPGNTQKELVLGTPEDDTLYPLGGWDYVDGGAGFDTVIVAGSHTQFRLSTEGGSTWVDVLSAASAFAGRVELRNVEQVQFVDLAVSLVVDDRIPGAPGSDVHDGGPGLDTVVYSGARAGYQVQRTGSAFLVVDLAGGEGDDRLVNVERIAFRDAALALDLDGAAGQAAKVLGAAFGAPMVREPSVAGIALALFDAGWSAERVADLAVSTDLFAWLAGSASTTDFVRFVYRNVVGAEPAAEVLAAFVAMVDSGAVTRGALVAMAAETPLNAAAIGLVGLAATGLDYLPFELPPGL
jgi:Ca2+-binding RTX toxin-like protein